nr:ammonium transporter [Bacillus sp. Marseille-P3661]
MVVQLNLNFVWVVLAAILVFFMQAGFTALEAGLVRAKNSINVAIKNVSDLLVSTIVFALFGFSIMFGPSNNGWFGSGAFFFSGIDDDPWNWAFLLFQIVFAGTAATIVSGAIAERVKFGAYLIGTFFIVLVIYPVFGHWAWGNLWITDQSGWLSALGFVDFAGSTVVHSIGGWVAFAAAIVVGPRIGKYSENGEIHNFKPSNIVLASIGVFILWLGWFGFNSGSTLVGDSSIALIALNTHLGATAGGVVAMLISWLINRRPLVDDILNGIIAGLVSVTAGAHVLTALTALIAGSIGGLLVVLSLRFIDRILKVDDAIGAVSVHGVCGAWGTLAVGLLGDLSLLPMNSRLDQVWVQFIGVTTAFIWSFGVGFIIYYIMKKLINIRPTQYEEEVGLNVSEHGAEIAMLETIQAMDEIASAQGDLTRLLKIEQGEDTTEVNLAFNKLLHTLNELIESVKYESAFVNKSSNELLELTKILQASSSKQLNTIRETHEVFLESDQRLAQEIDIENQIIATIQDSFASMEDVGNEIFAVKKDMDQVAAFMMEITKLNVEVKRTMDHFKGKVNKINEFSSESAHVIDVINGLTDQINLLSLNAGIEAARAGEYGKGFAVVAKQIKSLAVKSKQSTNEIKTIITDTVKTIYEGNNELEDFSNTITKLNGELLAMPIKLKKMDGQVQNVYEIMNSFSSQLQTVNKETSNMINRKYIQKDNFREMCQKVGTIHNQMEINSETMDKIVVSVKEMKQQSSALQKAVSQFKTTNAV